MAYHVHRSNAHNPYSFFGWIISDDRACLCCQQPCCGRRPASGCLPAGISLSAYNSLSRGERPYCARDIAITRALFAVFSPRSGRVTALNPCEGTPSIKSFRQT